MGKRFPYPVHTVAGPFAGVRTEPAGTNSNPAYAREIVNGYPVVSELGSGVRSRPPFIVASIGGVLGQVASRIPQGIYQAPQSDGTVVNVVFCGGKMYRVTPPGTITEITPSSGVTIDANARRVYAVPFFGGLVVSDGVNRPWLATNLTGTPCTGTYLTDASGAWYGPPVVYYAKVFGVRASARTTIEWSEEADAHTGYGNATYDNTWVFGQTSSSPVECLVATDDALYVFRRDSITLIAGSVTKDFASAGTREAVDPSLGTISAASVILAGDAIWFRGTDRQVYRLPLGGQPEPVWRQVSNFYTTATADEVATESVGVFHTGLSLVLQTVLEAGDPVQCQVFSTDGTYLGRWIHSASFVTLPQFGAMGMLWSSSDRTALLYHLSTDGQLYYSPFLTDTTADRGYDSPVYALGVYTHYGIGLQVQAPPLQWDEQVTCLWDRVTWTVRASSAAVAETATLDEATTRATFATAQNVTVTPTENTDTAFDVGTNAEGRWIMPRITFGAGAVAVGTRPVLSVLSVAASGTAITDAPGLG